MENINLDELPAIVSNKVAAQILGRSTQTLRKWKCTNEAPLNIKPVVINKRLSWKVEDLRRVIEGGSNEQK